MQENGLDKLLSEVDGKSESIGADITDYVLLHSYIRQYKVKYVLECGSGRSTWVIAHALQQLISILL